jgi:hypothetical protein
LCGSRLVGLIQKPQSNGGFCAWNPAHQHELDLDYKASDNPFGLYALMNNTSQLELLVLGFRLRGTAANQFE